jgi:hypothetical protein
MGRDLMWDCEFYKKRVDLNDTSKRIWEWTVAPVSGISDKDTIRCRHCHGPVRIHRKKKVNGPDDHVEHLEHEDTITCKGGYNFKGPKHQMSKNPIE